MRLYRNLLSGVVVIGLTLVSAAATAEVKWKAERVLLFGERNSSSSTSGVMEQWKVIRLAPAGSKRHLALVQKTVERISPWTDEQQTRREAREQGVVTSVKREVREDAMLLAILDDQGRILVRSEPHPEVGGEVAPAPGSWSVPLVLEQDESCAYALLHPFTAALYCYDFQLAFRRKLTLPLHEVGTPGVTFDGVAHTLWFFGRRFAAAPPPSTDRQAATEREPQPAEDLGARWRVGDESFTPLPLSLQELVRGAEAIARDPAGERLSVAAASVSLTPVRELGPGEDMEVLLQAVSSASYRSSVRFAGTRVFFRARLGPEGLGTVSQLPLWIVQGDSQGAQVDEKTGVVRLPAFATINDLQVFGLREKTVGIWLELAFKTPRADGSFDPRTWDVGKLFVIVSGTHLDQVFWLDDVLDEAGQTLSSENLSVRPIVLRDRVGTRSFGFMTSCRTKGKSPRPVPCMALLSLSF